MWHSGRQEEERSFWYLEVCNLLLFEQQRPGCYPSSQFGTTKFCMHLLPAFSMGKQISIGQWEILDKVTWGGAIYSINLQVSFLNIKGLKTSNPFMYHMMCPQGTIAGSQLIRYKDLMLTNTVSPPRIEILTSDKSNNDASALVSLHSDSVESLQDWSSQKGNIRWTKPRKNRGYTQ